MRLGSEAGAEQVHALDLIVTDIVVHLLLTDVPPILVALKAVANGEPVLHGPYIRVQEYKRMRPLIGSLFPK